MSHKRPVTGEPNMVIFMYVYTYIPQIALIVLWRCTILVLGEIERQPVKAPLAAAISPYLISPMAAHSPQLF